MITLRRVLCMVLGLLVATTPALAQQTVPVMVKVSSGTGFFVNRNGDVVTNAHVLKACRAISVKTPQGERAATLVAHDPARDLAVLRTEGTPAAIANLRWDIRDLRPGADVVVMGYPGQEGIAGKYRFTTTQVTDLRGPTGEPQWLQLNSVAEQGNSGGPVLDTAGNVIGVISANTMLYRTPTNGRGEPELISKADVAITLPVLEDFLREHQVGYYQASSGAGSNALRMLETRANRFIVPVRCYL